MVLDLELFKSKRTGELPNWINKNYINSDIQVKFRFYAVSIGTAMNKFAKAISNSKNIFPITTYDVEGLDFQLNIILQNIAKSFPNSEIIPVMEKLFRIIHKRFYNLLKKVHSGGDEPLPKTEIFGEYQLIVKWVGEQLNLIVSGSELHVILNAELNLKLKE